jgi:hypothetical protein
VDLPPAERAAAAHRFTTDTQTAERALSLAEASDRANDDNITHQTGHRPYRFVERGLAHVLVLQKTKLKEARQLLEASRAEYLQVYVPKNNVCVQCIDAAIADLNKITAQ